MVRRRCSARRTRRHVVRTAALLLAGAMTLTGCDFSVYSLPLPGGADLGDDPYRVRVQFHDVLDLVPQSAVKVADVTVGKVEDVRLDGYTAEVTVALRGDVKLPDNAVAEIRQTSLLGEKFVSLKAPVSGASAERLGDGDLIPLERSGRNPEVEEVLGALSLLLNGGGVAQLKTISSELNNALAGREQDVRSVLSQLDVFMRQIDDNKQQIVDAIESLNRLAVSINRQKDSIELALDEMPQALASIDRQRDDLVRMLDGLSRLSDVGTRVIRDSKVATIESLRALAPTLTKLAEAGDALPQAFQVFLTYPFVDAVVGKNPAQARNLHMGDYTNLSIQADLDFSGAGPAPNLPDPGDICALTPSNPICDEGGPVLETLSLAEKCILSGDPQSKACKKVTLKQVKETCKKKKYKKTAFCQAVLAVPDTPLDEGLPDLPDLPLLSDGPGGAGGLLRPAFGASASGSYDDELAPLLVWGMMNR